MGIVEVPMVQSVEKVVEIEVPGQTLQGVQHVVNVPIAPERQVMEVETVTVTEVGPPLPAEPHPEVVTKQAPPPQPVIVAVSQPAPVPQSVMTMVPQPVITAQPVMTAQQV